MIDKNKLLDNITVPLIAMEKNKEALRTALLTSKHWEKSNILSSEKD
ncbi:hypothetical protein HZA75_00890 [Candidatus Roizmanbacteria bacterium]|nr:hypothetical protein [Candidatus Roizmanbacteria bacterium]